MRPKYALWLFVAIVSSLWYLTDPQATLSVKEDSSTSDPADGNVAVADASSHQSPRVASRSGGY